MKEQYKIEKFAENDDGWDSETGNPGIMLVANAIQVWSIFQNEKTSIYEAGKAFNMNVKDVLTAIHAHPWMSVVGDGIIEHEGE